MRATPSTGTSGREGPRDARTAGWPLGRAFGVPLRMRPSTLVTAALLWVALYVQLAPPATRLSVAAAVVLCTLTTVGFFASVLAHELSHAALGRLLGLDVRGVTIFYLGGVTELDSEPEEPQVELAIAVAGPLTNLTLGAVLLAVAGLGGGPVAGVSMRFLGEINVAIGAFNLLPGHPLDGGAILRAGLWRATGDRLRAARTTARAGQGLAYGLIGAGVVGLFRDGTGDPALVWLAVVGLFILTAARTGLVQAELRQRLSGQTVADVLHPSPWTGEIGWTVARVVADVVRSQTAGLVVDAAGRPVGAFGPDELADIPSSTWDHLTLGETMREVRGSVDQRLPLADVLPRFEGDTTAALAVTDAGGPIGVVTAEQVIARVRRST